MEYKFLSLHFTQLSKVWNRSRHNSYSDKRKQEYQQSLGHLYERLSKEAPKFDELSFNDISDRKKIIDFLFKSLEFLDNSTFTLFPYEIIECLEYALNEWKSNNEFSYIVVTSLVNGINKFSFDSQIANREYYELIEKLYDIKLDYRLIQISLPKYLSKDYLANVVLYHELGHFIDNTFKISDRLAMKIYVDWMEMVDKNKEDLFTFFDFLRGKFGDNEQKTLQRHIAEYFCDIFASQYIGKSANEYLKYNTIQNTHTGYTHPSTNDRIKIVDMFLDKNTDNWFLNELIEATKNITKKCLEVRYAVFPDDDFINLIPPKISSIGQLHYLFILGWELWRNGKERVRDNNKMEFDLSDEQFYSIINNLIEKSIGNFIIENTWNKSYNDVSTKERT